jgi:hypothetical protein
MTVEESLVPPSVERHTVLPHPEVKTPTPELERRHPVGQDNLRVGLGLAHQAVDAVEERTMLGSDRVDVALYSSCRHSSILVSVSPQTQQAVVAEGDQPGCPQPVPPCCARARPHAWQNMYFAPGLAPCRVPTAELDRLPRSWL